MGGGSGGSAGGYGGAGGGGEGLLVAGREEGGGRMGKKERSWGVRNLGESWLVPPTHSPACICRWQSRLFPLLLGLQPLPVGLGPDGLLPRRRGRGADGRRGTPRGCCGGSSGTERVPPDPPPRTAGPGPAAARYSLLNPGGRDAAGGDRARADGPCHPQPGSTTRACSAWRSAAPEPCSTTASPRTRAPCWQDSATC